MPTALCYNLMRLHYYKECAAMTPSPLLHIKDNIYNLRALDRIVGGYLYDSMNDEVGRVKGLMVEPETYRTRYLVYVNGGMMFTEGKIIILPREMYDPIDSARIKSSKKRESIQQAPSPRDFDHLTREDEMLVLGYFDLKPYWDTETNESLAP